MKNQSAVSRPRKKRRHVKEPDEPNAPEPELKPKLEPKPEPKPEPEPTPPIEKIKQKRPSKAHQLREVRRRPSTKKYSFQRAVNKTYGEYCNETSIQGIPYLHPKNSLRDKVFWGLFILISIVICLNQLKYQFQRWRISPVIITFSEEPMAVSQTPFPAITICSETKALKTERHNFTRFYYYLRTFENRTIEPPPWLSEDEFIKMRALLQVCGNHVVKNMIFPEYPPMVVTDHLNEMNPIFEDKYVYCVFNQSQGACRPFFEKIYTKEGICYTFNALNETELYRSNTHQYKYFEKDSHLRVRNLSLSWDIVNGFQTPDAAYPERSIGSGIRAGFSVSLNEEEKHLDYNCRGPVEGFKVILHSPDDIAHVDKSYIHVPYKRDVTVLVTPHFIYTTSEVDEYAPKRRNCYYPHERYLKFFKFYTQSNCDLECLANFTLHICGCVQFSMPRVPETPVCDASKILCYDRAENDFLLSEYTGMGHKVTRCDCLAACFMLTYRHEVSHGIFNILHIQQDFDVDSLTGNITKAMISRLRVFFRDNEFTARKRAELYGLNDFLANCGGLMGLFIGLSVLSIVQLVYYFTARLYWNREALKSNPP